MTTPEWVSFDLFQKSLNNYLNENVKLLNFRTTNAVPEGDNYTSDLYRATLIYIDKKNVKSSVSVIVKCGNEDGGVKTDIAQKLHLFDKEVEIFTKTFPALYEILGENYIFSSKCFYTSTSPHAIIVLEDLTTLGFQMLPRHIGFDLEHCFKVIEKMAQLHAASVIMYKKDPASVKFYGQGLYADNDMIRDWITAGFTGLIDACSRWPGFEKYGYKLEALGLNEILRRGFKSIKRKFGGFHVLNHGDLWVNNMMFSYDNITSKLKDMRFVDFQMNIFTSPAIDLHYFIATSTQVEVKIAYIDNILDYYYSHLLANLSKLQYSLEKVPTREELRRDYNSRSFYGLLGAATVLPFVKASKRKDASFENIIKDDSLEGFRYHAYNNDRYRKHMELLLPYYDGFGILD